MLGDRRPAGAKIRREFADAITAAAQQSEDLTPRRIGDRSKYRCCACSSI
jgi:hypothetical protein